MNQSFHRSPSTGFRVFNACLLSFLLIMMPFAQLAAAMRRSEIGAERSGDRKQASQTKSAVEDLFVNPPAVIGITATKTDAFPSHPSGMAEPGDVIDYTVDVTNPTGFDALGVLFSDTIDPNTTRVGATGNLKASPLALNDTYFAEKDTLGLNVSAPGVLTNDSGEPAPTVSGIPGCVDVTAPFVCGTTGSGTVTLNTDGSFTYVPGSGFTGADTFTYSTTNGQAPPFPGVDNVATVTINVDAAPTVQSTTPADNAVNQNTDTNIGITFSEPVNVTGSWFTISCSVSGAHTATVTGGTTTYALNPDTDFTQGETCTVTVVAAQVTDVDTNDPPDSMAANYVFDFTMDAAPSVTATTPVDTATGVGTQSDITLTFSESVNLTAAPVTISCATSGAHNTYTVSASPNTLFTINPSVDFVPNELCTVTVLANQVSDADSNDPPNNMVADYVFTFTTDAAPTVTGTTPTAGASNVPSDVNIVVNFSETVNVTASAFTLTCNSVAQPFTLSPVPPGGVNSFTLDPNSNLPAGSSCTMTVVANQVSDTDGGDPPDNMVTNHVLNFTVDAAPTVTATTPTNLATQIANNTNITITFSESVNLGATPVTISCATSGAHTSVVSASPNTVFTVNPDTDFANGEVCTVTVLAAQVTDNDTNDPPDNMAVDYVFSFTIDNPPSVTTTVPINNATDIAQSSTITINFSEPVNVAAGGITINCGSAVAFTPGLPQNNVSSLVLTPTGGLPAGSNCTVTVLAANVTDFDSGDPPDNMTADYVFTFKVKPDAVNDNVQTATGQTVLGNVNFISSNIPYSVTTNDVSANAFTVTAFDATSVNGGTVSVAANGQFTYNPPRGFEGSDTFNYTISRTDGGGTDSATVTITVSGMIWFIQNGAAACSPNCGRLTNPYPTLAAFNTDNALSGGLNPDNNDNIFIYESASAYTGAVTLRSGQKLIGQDATATLYSITGLTQYSGHATLPAMDSGNGVFTNITNTVTMHNNSVVRGLRINVTGTDKGLVAVTKTGLVVNDVATISSVNGTAVDFSGSPSSGTFTFTNISASGSGAGLSFASTTSASTVTVNNVTTTTGVAVNASSTGATDFTFNDVTSTTGTAVDINTSTGDFIFHAITKNGGSTGIDVDNATGSFTVNGTSTTAGTGGTIQNTTSHGAKFIGSNNITLKNMNLTSNAQTQSSSNLNCGNNLVAGNTTLCTANLYLSSVTTISLTNLSISGSTQEGIAGTTVSGLTLANSTIESNGNEDYENGLLFKNLTGTVSITNSNIRNNFSRQGHIFNDGANALTLNVTGTLFGRTVAPGVSSQQGLLMELQGTTSTNVDVGTSSFNNNGNGNGLQINAASSATVGTVGTHSSVHNSTSMTNNAAHVFVNTSGSATMYFDTMNNAVMTVAGLQSIDYFANGGNLTGIIQGNTIGTNGSNQSGCNGANGCDGMTIDKALTGNLSLRIESNIIQQINTNGIALGGNNSGGSINASIINNTIRQPSNSAATNSQGNAMYLNIGVTSGSTFTACLNVTGNTISDTASKTWDINGSFAMIYVRARNSATIRIPGASAGTAAAADTFITNNNTFTRVFVPNVEPVLTEAVGGGTYTNGAACSVPLLLADGGVDAISFLSALTDLATNASSDRHNLGTVSSLTQSQLDAIVAAATQRWMATGLTQQQIAAMRELRFELGDLAASYLGEASGNRIVVDRNAQGKGWFIDTTPADDAEFGTTSSSTRRYTNPFTSAAGRIDLLTAIEHEIGHKLGLGDSYSEKDRDSIMYGYLTVGERRVPAKGQATGAKSDALSSVHYLKLKGGKAEGSSQKAVSRKNHAATSRALAAPMSGETISHTIGTLPAGKHVRITFQVTVDSPFLGPNQVSNQGTVTGTLNASPFNVQTDDPSVGGASDPTVTPVAGPPTANVKVQDATVAEPATGTTNMVFTVTLSTPAGPSGASVDFTTADQAPAADHAVAGTCGSGGDYTTTSGTINFTSGQQVKSISVPVCSDTNNSEVDETFLVNLSNPMNVTIADGTATGTITVANTAGTFLISELRTSGPGGANDDFVEVYNNSDSPLTVTATDGSAGYGVYKMGSDCNATPVLIGTIPNTTVIPARGHYLLVGSAYSLSTYPGGNNGVTATTATGDQVLTADIENDRNVAVFSTANVANISSTNRLDAVGFGLNTGSNCDLLREGSTLPPVSGSTTEHSFFRKLCDFVGGVGCSTPGTPKDTNNNATDFLLADTAGTNFGPGQQLLGAPGPENKTAPLKRDPAINLLLLDASVPQTAVPNRFRDGTAGPNATFGTLSVRRRVINNTGGNVTRLRYRIVEFTTAPSPGGGTADLRALTSVDVTVANVNDGNTCFASNGVATTPCTVTVKGTTLETPPNQSLGGGMNSTLSSGTVTLGTPLANGASINVQFLLGVQTPGTFRFLIIVEALP